jgi:two-component system chemotaxis sensor kinase CheA
MSNNDEIFSEFLEEAQELLANFESCLKELDEDHSQSDKVAEAFRYIHTLKGNSSCFSMTDLTEIAHVMEDVMSRARNGTMKISSNLIDDLLVGVDRVGAILNEPDKDHLIEAAEIMTLFTKHNQLNGVTFSPEETKENVKNPYLDINIKSPNFIYWIRCTKSDSPDLLSELGEFGEIHKHDSGVDYDDFLFESVLEKSFLQILKYEIHVEEILEESDLVLENNKESIADTKTQEYLNRESFARISYQLLDQLMELSGEIILCRNQFTRKLPPELLQDFHALSVLINDMQDGLMMTRMQPFKVVSGKFPRMIRETAR